MEQERALVNLEHNDRLDVAWSMTSVERDQRLLIELHNPLLPSATPWQRRELWFTAPPVR